MQLDEISANLMEAMRQLIIATVQPMLSEPQQPEPQALPPVKEFDRRYDVLYSDLRLDLRKIEPFVYKWADGPETFPEACAGTVSYSTATGENRQSIKIGITNRVAAEKDRVRVVILIDSYLTVEFAGAQKREDSQPSSLVASILKENGKTLPIDAKIPWLYGALGLKVLPYRTVVDGRYAKNCLAIICRLDDLRAMVQHALIRYHGRADLEWSSRNFGSKPTIGRAT